MIFSSRILEEVILELEKLPGVGRKTATRFALYLLKQKNGELEKLISTLKKMKEKLYYCKICFTVSDTEICSICANTGRNRQMICVVENIQDMLAIESTGQYNGLFHVLGGVISPVEGIGPADLTISALLRRLTEEEVKEVILALSPTIEGDTTNFYLYKQIYGLRKEILLTTIARGIAIGNQLEYTDEITLARSLINRIPYENILPVKNT